MARLGAWRFVPPKGERSQTPTPPIGPATGFAPRRAIGQKCFLLIATHQFFYFGVFMTMNIQNLNNQLAAIDREISRTKARQADLTTAICAGGKEALEEAETLEGNLAKLDAKRRLLEAARPRAEELDRVADEERGRCAERTEQRLEMIKKLPKALAGIEAAANALNAAVGEYSALNDRICDDLDGNRNWEHHATNAADRIVLGLLHPAVMAERYPLPVGRVRELVAEQLWRAGEADKPAHIVKREAEREAERQQAAIPRQKPQVVQIVTGRDGQQRVVCGDPETVQRDALRPAGVTPAHR